MGKPMKAIYRVEPSEQSLTTRVLGNQLALPNPLKTGGKILIGRREWISLPALGVSPLNAKTDSGARSSSVHAEEVVLCSRLDEVEFTMIDHYANRIRCRAAVCGLVPVRSSSGIAERRIFIETEARLPGGFEWRIRVSLADRSVMKCPMLIGRQAMAGYFLIDPQASHLAGRRQDLSK